MIQQLCNSLRRTRTIGFCAIVWATTSSVRAVIITEPFNTAASATTNGWAQSASNPGGGSSYGFSNTDNTGGSSPNGEAGGTFARTGTANYYADLTIGGTFNRTSVLSATGEIDITAVNTAANSMLIGYLNASLGSPLGFIGVAIADQTATTVRFRTQIAFSDGTLAQGNQITTVVLGEDRTFSFAFNPTGGIDGVGQLTGSISGTGGGSSTLDLTIVSHAGKNLSLNAFGLAQFAFITPSAASNFTAYVDNIAYVVIPEPTAVALLMMGTVGLVFFRRNFSRIG